MKINALGNGVGRSYEGDLFLSKHLYFPKRKVFVNAIFLIVDIALGNLRNGNDSKNFVHIHEKKKLCNCIDTEVEHERG